MDPDSATALLQFITPLLVLLSANINIVLIVIIVVLLVFTAIIAGSEVALFSLSAKEINHLKQHDGISNNQILKLIEKPKKLLATLLIANNFLSIAVIITTNLLIKNVLQIHTMFPTLSEVYITLISIAIQVVLVTFFLVLFGEVLPKVYATQNNLRMSMFAAPFISLLDKFFSPVSNLLVSSTSFIEGKFVSRKNEISQEDVENAIELTVGHSATKEEVNIFKGILKFGDIMVKQIMHTRMDLSGIDYSWNFYEVKKQVIDTGFSRLPVYNETFDEIKGIIHSKDLLPYVQETTFDWHPLIRPAFYVHETKLIEDLLAEFQKKRSHMAIVVDEFGGTSGIITLEDIMEEIIGDIKDEFDDDDIQVKKIDEHNFIFEGKTLLNDVCRYTAVPVEIFDDVRGESDSLAGLVLEISGKFPIQNQEFKYKNYLFTVLQLDKLRIQKVKMTILPENNEA